MRPIGVGIRKTAPSILSMVYVCCWLTSFGGFRGVMQIRIDRFCFDIPGISMPITRIMWLGIRRSTPWIFNKGIPTSHPPISLPNSWLILTTLQPNRWGLTNKPRGGREVSGWGAGKGGWVCSRKGWVSLHHLTWADGSLSELTLSNVILSVIYVDIRNSMKSFSLFWKRQNSMKGFQYFSARPVN